MDLTAHWIGLVAIGVFVLAYSLVIVEEGTHLRKSVPVIALGYAASIWVHLIVNSRFNGVMP